MKWLGYILLLHILLPTLFTACKSEEEGIPQSTSSQQEAPPDSTGYYDSLNAPYKAKIDSFFHNLIEQKRFNGSFLFADHGHIIHKKIYGYANYHQKDTLTEHSAFQLASASKPFTATAVLMLADQGKVHLDDSIRKYIPELPYAGITIRMLLNHRGGLGNYIYFTEHEWKDDTTGGYLTNQGVLDFWKDSIPDIYYPPDKKFDYSNTGYMLLAVLVEQVSGQQFKDWMDTHIFDPLGMEDAYIIDKANSDLPPNATLGHLWDYRAPGNDYLNGVVGDKGMYASASDLFKFDQALYSSKLFKNDSLIEWAMKAQNPVKRDSSSYGYGWRLINPKSPNRIVYHTGWWQGYRTYFIRYPKSRKTAIVLDNIKRGPFLSVKTLLGLIEEDYASYAAPPSD